MTATVIPFPKDRIKIERRIGIAREIETMEDILNRWRDQDLQAPDLEPMSDWLKDFLRPLSLPAHHVSRLDVIDVPPCHEGAPWYQDWLAKWYGADGKSMPPTYPRRR